VKLHALAEGIHDQDVRLQRGTGEDRGKEREVAAAAQTGGEQDEEVEGQEGEDRRADPVEGAERRPAGSPVEDCRDIYRVCQEVDGG
jgi:hypothetical protein